MNLASKILHLRLWHFLGVRACGIFFGVLCLLNMASAVTITATGSGNWSAAGSWDLARVPITTDIVVIPAPRVINYDMNNSTINCATISIQAGGTLNVSSYIANRTLNLTLSGDVFVNGGLFIEGTVNVKFHSQSSSGQGSEFFRGIELAEGGHLALSGNAKDVQVSLNSLASLFDASFVIDHDAVGWNAGDVLYLADVTAGGGHEFVTINTISGTTIFLTTGLKSNYTVASTRILNLSRSAYIGPVVADEASNFYVSADATATLNAKYAEIAYLGSAQQGDNGFYLNGSMIDLFYGNSLHHCVGGFQVLNAYAASFVQRNMNIEANVIYHLRGQALVASKDISVANNSRSLTVSGNAVFEGISGSSNGFVIETPTTLNRNLIVNLKGRGLSDIASSNLILSNTFFDVQDHAILLTEQGAAANTIIGNLLVSGNENAIHMITAPNNTVSANDISNFNHGLYLATGASNNQLIANTMSNARVYGLALLQSNRTLVSGNMISGGTHGLYIFQSASVTLNNNGVTGNSGGNGWTLDTCTVNAQNNRIANQLNGMDVGTLDLIATQNIFVNNAGTDVFSDDTASANMYFYNSTFSTGNTLTASQFIWSYRHNQTAGHSQLYGYYRATGETLRFEYGPETYLTAGDGNTDKALNLEGQLEIASGAGLSLTGNSSCLITGVKNTAALSVIGGLTLNHVGVSSLNVRGLYLEPANSVGVSLSFVTFNNMSVPASAGQLMVAAPVSVTFDFIQFAGSGSNFDVMAVNARVAIFNPLRGIKADSLSGTGTVIYSPPTQNRLLLTGGLTAVTSNVVTVSAYAENSVISFNFYSGDLQAAVTQAASDLTTFDYVLTLNANTLGTTVSIYSQAIDTLNVLSDIATISFFYTWVPTAAYIIVDGGQALTNNVSASMTITFDIDFKPIQLRIGGDGRNPLANSVTGLANFTSPITFDLLTDGAPATRNIEVSFITTFDVQCPTFNATIYLDHVAPEILTISVYNDTQERYNTVGNGSTVLVTANISDNHRDLMAASNITADLRPLGYGGNVVAQNYDPSTGIAAWNLAQISISAEARVIITISATDLASNNREATGSIIGDTVAPYISTVSVFNSAFDTYGAISNGSTAVVTALVIDTNRAIIETRMITADLRPLGYGAAVSADSYAANTGVAQWSLASVSVSSETALTIKVGVWDEAGNMSTENTGSIIGDTTAPVVTTVNIYNQSLDTYYVVDAGNTIIVSAGFTETTILSMEARMVTANLSELGYGAVVSADGFFAPTAAAVWTLSAVNPSRDGVIVVTVSARDAAGNLAIEVTGNILADSLNPEITSASIYNQTHDTYSSVANGSTVVVTANVSDGNRNLLTVNDITADLRPLGYGAVVSADSYNSSTGLATWTLTSTSISAEATLTVTMVVRDIANHQSTRLAVSIIGDNTAPQLTTINVYNQYNGRYFTVKNGSAVIVTALVSEGNLGLLNSNMVTADLSLLGYSASATPNSFSVSSGLAQWTLSEVSLTREGILSINVRVRDDAGNLATLLDSRILGDNTPPTLTLSIDNNPGSLSQPTFNLRVAVTDNFSLTPNVVMWMAESHSLDVVGVTENASLNVVENFIELHMLDISQNTLVTVDVTAFDEAWNQTVTASIGFTYVNSPPTVNAYTIGNGSGYILGTQATFSVTVQDSETNMSFLSVTSDNDTQFPTPSLSPQTLDGTLNFPNVPGPVTFSITVADVFWITRSVQNIAITYDAAAPTGTLTMAEGYNIVSSNWITLNLTLSDDVGTSENVLVWLDSSNTALGQITENAFIPYQQQYYINLTLASRQSTTLSMVLMDPAGRLSVTLSTAVSLDNIGPENPRILLNDGAIYVSANTVNVAYYAEDPQMVYITITGDIVDVGVTFSFTTSGLTANQVITLNTTVETTKNISVQFSNLSEIPSQATDDIVYDATPPVISMAIDGSPVTLTVPSFNLRLRASDTISATPDMISVFQELHSHTVNGLTLNTTLNFFENDEAVEIPGATHNLVVTLDVYVYDQASNLSTASVYFQYHNTWPSFSAYTIGNGSGYIQGLTATYSVTVTDDERNVKLLETYSDISYNIQGFDEITWTATGEIGIPDTPGMVSFSFYISDALHSTTSLLALQVTYDARIPSGTFAIADAVMAVSANNVSFNLTVSDDVGNTSNMRVKFISTQSDLSLITENSYLPFAATFFPVHLGLQNRVSTDILVQFMDPSGRESEIITYNVILLGEPPDILTLTINRGVLITSQNVVTVSVSARDHDLTTVSIAGDVSPPFAVGHTTSDLVVDIAVTLDTSTQGTKTITYAFSDEINLTSNTTNAIMYDSLGPSMDMTVGLGGDLLFSNWTTLSISARDANYSTPDIAIMVWFENISPSSQLTLNVFVPLSSFPVTMFMGLSYHQEMRMYVVGMDGLGNTTDPVLVTASLQISSAEPSQTVLALRGGATYTNQAQITASYYAYDEDLRYVNFSGDVSPSVTYDYTYAQTQSSLITLDSGREGVKTVLATFFDSNESQGLTSDFIIYDATGPSGNLQVGDGSGYSGRSSFDIFFNVEDNFSGTPDIQMKLSSSGGNVLGLTLNQYLAFQPYLIASTNVAELSAFDLSLTYMDAAGNERSGGSYRVTYDSSYIDTTPPTNCRISRLLGLEETYSRFIYLNFSADGGFNSITLSGDVTASMRTISSEFSNARLEFSTGYGTKNMEAVFVDAAGNRSSTVSFSIMYRPRVVLNSGKTKTFSPWINLTILGNEEAPQMYVSGDIQSILGQITEAWTGVSASMLVELKQNSVANTASKNIEILFGSGGVAMISAFPEIALVSDTDSDSDGMSDAWERTYNLDPNDAADGQIDKDDDGLPNALEYQYGSDPGAYADSDADGMSDDWESAFGLNPLVVDSSGDNDGDGLSNLSEFESSSHPLITNGNKPPLSVTDNQNVDRVALILASGTVSTLNGQTDPGTLLRVYRHFTSRLYPSAVLDTAGSLVHEIGVSADGRFEIPLIENTLGGLYTYTVAAINPAGDIQTMQLLIYIDVSPPNIKFVQLNRQDYYYGQVVTSSSPELLAYVTDDVGVATISLVQNSGVTLNLIGQSGVSYNFDTGHFSYSGLSLSQGENILLLSATDTANQTSTTTLTLYLSNGQLTLIYGPRVFPNPVNGSVGYIGYILSEPGDIGLRIYNINGEQIWDSSYPSGSSGGAQGYNEVSWDLRDGWGRPLANGIYIGLLLNNGRVVAKVKIAVYR